MKINRHAKIVELINKYHIETQEELASYLKEAGFHGTYATKPENMPLEEAMKREVAMECVKKTASTCCTMHL